MKKPVPFVDLSRQHTALQSEIEKQVLTIMRKGNYILGTQVEQFEKLFAKATHSAHAIGIANGTDGLLMSFRALDIGQGDEVITVSHTFIATALGISYAGATPVFVDIHPDTLNMNPDLIEAKITKKTRAILPVCLYGQPPQLDKIAALARKYKLKVVLDACQSHGATYNAKPLMHYADAVVYSFYPTKNLGAYGDGGAITVQNSKMAERLTILRNVGRDGWYQHPVKGYNSRLDALQAAILSVKLKKLTAWNALRKSKAEWYNKNLTIFPIILPTTDPKADHVYYLYVIQTPKRDKLQQYLETKGIHTAVHYPVPIHLQPAYKELGYKKGSLPVSENAADQILSLPFFPHITISEQQRVVRSLELFFNDNSVKKI